ncbi:hypothetical protein TL16_g11783 [Triparma laevis f. inornata]|uniref:Uncharacterized protein n=1 Tax=Triparma laevis f. inornata TaxID=1714386 RepID=A0A9W7BHC8_9STRA|nr:hypothetical protein TL16_g11783 [Triparma laevis f. inornata]
MHTPEFRRYFVEFAPVDVLMALRVATTAWKVVAEEVIDECVKSGAIIVHDGKSISVSEALARRERPELLTRVIFLLNITKVGNRACQFTSNLVIVVNPEGVESISYAALASCRSLATVSFLTTY